METRKINPNLKGEELKKALRKIKRKKDHRGIKYNKKTGLVTAI